MWQVWNEWFRWCHKLFHSKQLRISKNLGFVATSESQRSDSLFSKHKQMYGLHKQTLTYSREHTRRAYRTCIYTHTHTMGICSQTQSVYVHMFHRCVYTHTHTWKYSQEDTRYAYQACIYTHTYIYMYDSHWLPPFGHTYIYIYIFVLSHIYIYIYVRQPLTATFWTWLIVFGSTMTYGEGPSVRAVTVLKCGASLLQCCRHVYLARPWSIERVFWCVLQVCCSVSTWQWVNIYVWRGYCGACCNLLPVCFSVCLSRNMTYEQGASVRVSVF